MDNPHAGHRKRLKERFLQDGLDYLSPSQVIELLLFYTVPRADVFPAAEELIKRFKSVDGVLSAGKKELLAVDGVGEASAALINLISQMRSYNPIVSLEGRHIESTKELCRLFTAVYRPAVQEQARLICIDDKLVIKKSCVLSVGSDYSVSFEPQKIVDIVKESGCTQCAIAHNHPNSKCEPSEGDISATNQLRRYLKDNKITLIDHIIVGCDGARTLFSGEIEQLLR